MDQSQKPKSWKKKLVIGAVIYVVAMIVLITVAVLLSTEVPQQSGENFSRLSNLDSTKRIASGTIIPDYAPTTGKADARVTIVEFGDFQCPFCKASYSTMKRVLDRYPDDVRLVYRHFPIASLHPLAKDLAHASMCANDQGRFWQFHDRIFQYQDSITKDNIEEQAKAVGLGADLFKICQASGKWDEAIEQDFADIVSLGGKGTPSWIINGQLMQGHLSFETWVQIIDSLL